jgi:hypothetical protein
MAGPGALCDRILPLFHIIERTTQNLDQAEGLDDCFNTTKRSLMILVNSIIERNKIAPNIHVSYWFIPILAFSGLAG